MKKEIRKALLAALGGALIVGEKAVVAKKKVGELIKLAIEKGELNEGQVEELVDKVVVVAKQKLNLARTTIICEVNKAAKKMEKATRPPKKPRQSSSSKKTQV